MPGRSNIQLIQSLIGEVYDFRNESLDSSKFAKNNSIKDILSDLTLDREEKTVDKPQVCAAGESVIQVVSQDSVNRWFTSKSFYKGIPDLRGDISIIKKYSKIQSYQVLCVVSESFVRLCPISESIDWFIGIRDSKKSACSFQERIAFLLEIASTTIAKLEYVSCYDLSISTIIDLFLQEWDRRTIHTILRLKNTDSNIKLDESSLASTMTNRLFGFWKTIITQSAQGPLKNSSMTRCVFFASKKRSFIDCVRMAFDQKPQHVTEHSSKKREVFSSLPEILLLLSNAEIKNKESNQSKPQNKQIAQLKCIGFPLKLTFTTGEKKKHYDQDKSSEMDPMEERILLSADRNEDVMRSNQYHIHSIGFFETYAGSKAEGPRFTAAWRSEPSTSTDVYGLWSTASFSANAEKTESRLASFHDLQQKSIAFACFVRDRSHLQEDKCSEDVTDAQQSEDKSESDDNSYQDELVSSDSDNSSAASRDGEESRELCMATEFKPRSLLERDEARSQASLPPEQNLGFALHDAEWHHALDQGKKKKVKTKRDFGAEINRFQRFIESPVNYEAVKNKLMIRKRPKRM